MLAFWSLNPFPFQLHNASSLPPYDLNWFHRHHLIAPIRYCTESKPNWIDLNRFDSIGLISHRCRQYSIDLAHQYSLQWGFLQWMHKWSGFVKYSAKQKKIPDGDETGKKQIFISFELFSSHHLAQFYFFPSNLQQQPWVYAFCVFVQAAGRRSSSVRREYWIRIQMNTEVKRGDEICMRNNGDEFLLWNGIRNAGEGGGAKELKLDQISKKWVGTNLLKVQWLKVGCRTLCFRAVNIFKLFWHDLTSRFFT